MELIGRHLKAIGLYAKQNGLRLALSVPPRINFMKGNEVVTSDLTLLMTAYDSEMKQRAKERAKERARERRAEKEYLKRHPEVATLSH